MIKSKLQQHSLGNSYNLNPRIKFIQYLTCSQKLKVHDDKKYEIYKKYNINKYY